MKKITLSFCALALMLSTVKAQWQQVSGLYGGGVTCMATSGPNVFAGTGNGGIYLSTDTGKSWKPVNNGLKAHSISAMAVMGSTVFASTRDYQTYHAIFLSSDNGANWTQI